MVYVRHPLHCPYVFFDLDDATCAAESLRVQGKRWRIAEVPGCLFQAADRALLVVEGPNVDRPFSSQGYSLSAGRSIREIARIFEVSGPFSLRRFLTTADGTPIGEGQFNEWAVGCRWSAYVLRWRSSSRVIDVSGVVSIVRTFQSA